MKKIFSKIILLATFAVALWSCKGEEGLPGPAGQDGKDGIEYEFYSQDGNIVVTFEGSRPGDGVPFKDTVDFKYTDPYFPAMAYNSFEYWLIVVNRYEAIPLSLDENAPKNSITIALKSFNWEEANKTAEISSIHLSKTFRTADNKIFYIQEKYSDIFKTATVSDLFYNPDTGELRFNFVAVVPADANATGHELTMKGSVNVIMYEELKNN